MDNQSLPLNNIQDILSYLGKECYQDKDNKTHIRFIPGIFDDTIGYLFDDVEVEEFVLSSSTNIHSWEIIRPNSTCKINYTTCNGVENPEYEIDYYFNTLKSWRAYENTITFGGNNYIFYSNNKRPSKREKSVWRKRVSY
jgi:hypothetical protein